LVTDFADTTLFDQSNMLPGDRPIGRYFTVTNTSADTSYPLYFVAQKTGSGDKIPVDFSEVLNITIEKEGEVLVWNKTLKELFDKVDEGDGLDEDDGFSLETTLGPAESQKFFISVEFTESVGNEFKNKEVVWDAILGFVGTAITDEDVLGTVTKTDLIYFVLGSLAALGGGLYLHRRLFQKRLLVT